MAIVNTIRTTVFDRARAAYLTLLSQRERWILWLPVPFSLGIGAYFSKLAEPSPWMAIALLTVILPALWIKRGSWTGIGLILVALTAGGFAAAQWRTQSLDTVMLYAETGPITIEGRVTEVDALPKGLRVTISEARLAGGWTYRDEPLPPQVRVRLKAKDRTVPRAGDAIRLRSVLLPLSGPTMPGAFDFQRHAYFTGLGATGYAIGDIEIVEPLESGGDFFESLRHAIRLRIEAGVQDRETAAVLTAFLIGETKGISDGAWEYIRASGIAHLLAISGFHVTVVTGALFFLVRALLALWTWAALHWPIKKISAAIAMAGAIFYLQLIGSPITAERSVIMASVVMLAIMLDRDPFSLRLAAFAALLLLALQPEALVGPSFQMSFAAVVALIAFYEGPGRRWLVAEGDRTFLRKIWVYLVACLLTTVIATIATAPYTLYHFGQVPVLSGLAANMIAVPLSSLVTLPLGILACLLMPFGLEHLPLWVAAESMDVIMRLAYAVAQWRHAVVRVNAFGPEWLAVFTCGALWICIWRGRLRWLGLVPVAIAAMGVLTAPRPVALISDNGRLMAVRDAGGGWWLSNLRREKFVAESWLEREAANNAHRAAGDWRSAQDNGIIRCDSRACLYRAENGAVISFVTMPESVVEDCGLADLFIAPLARLDGKLCPRSRRRMIDTYDLRYDGAHAVYQAPGGRLTVAKVADTRGQRPWVPRPPPKPEARKRDQ